MMSSQNLKPDLEAYRLMSAGRFTEALPFARQAVDGLRICVPAHALLATILANLGKTHEAESVIETALACEAGGADAYDALAHVSMLLGAHERSNHLYRRAAALSPNTPRFWYNLASSDRSWGRLLEAEDACNRAISLDSTQYASYLLRSELRVQTPSANHIADLHSLVQDRRSDDRARMFLGYALGKELDDVGRFDDAFHAFSDAAQTRRRNLSYDVNDDERKIQSIIDAYPAKAVRSSGDNESARHIFIVGLPRSGTTLLERILSGLKSVRSNGETDNFARSLLSASPPNGANVFLRAAAADPQQVASQYDAFVGARALGERIIEKLPMNYLYLGAIHRALPNAKLLLVGRSPIDSCFAMYRTLFGAAYPFSYDLEELARYYAAYEHLTRHWLASFPERIHEVCYEDLVREPLTIGADVARYCDLEWNDAAIDVQNNASASLTASASQVRRPIYGSSSGRWRHYRTHLGPLIRALAQRGVALPDDA
jgi:Flp pilus assembly protein TadD